MPLYLNLWCRMARLLFNIASKVSGKMNGLVFSRNRYGSNVRPRVQPTNPRTPSQINARARFATSSAAWSSLSPSEQAAWAAYAAAVPVRDKKLSGTINITANAMYTRCGAAFGSAGIVFPVAAPTVMLMPTFDVPTVATVPTTGNVTAVMPTAGQYQIQVSRSKGAGINFFTGPFRVVTTVIVTAGQIITIANPYGDVYGADSKVWLRFRRFEADGRVSEPVIAMSGYIPTPTAIPLSAAGGSATDTLTVTFDRDVTPGAGLTFSIGGTSTTFASVAQGGDAKTLVWDTATPAMAPGSASIEIPTTGSVPGNTGGPVTAILA